METHPDLSPPMPVTTGSETPEARVDAVDRVLDEVEAALTRLDDGSYGRCEVCGAPIDEARLSEDPVARECRSCAPTAAD